MTLGEEHSVDYNSASQFPGESQHLARTYRSSNAKYTVISPSPTKAGMLYTEDPFNTNPYRVYSDAFLQLEEPLADEQWYNEMPHVSCGPEKSGVVRMYGVVHPNRIVYRDQSTDGVGTSSITEQLQFDEPSPWTNITSNVAEHPTYDLIAYSVNHTYNGAAKFRNKQFDDIGELKMYEHYTVNEFVPGSDQLLIYYPYGKICFLDFVPSGSFSVSQGSCHPMISLHIRMLFDTADSRFIAIRESTVAVYDFPSFSLRHTYAESPNYSDMIYNNQYQYHTYTNLYVRKFDTSSGEYVGEPIVTGNVEIAKINPHDEDYLFYMMDGLIKRIRISTGEVSEYDLKSKVNYSYVSLTDFSLRAFDIHKLSTNKIGALYCGIKAYTNPNWRVCIHVEYHYDLDEAFYYILPRSRYSTWRTLSIGAHNYKVGVDVWVTNGSATKSIYSYTTDNKTSGERMSTTMASTYLQRRTYHPVYYSNILKSNLYTAGF